MIIIEAKNHESLIQHVPAWAANLLWTQLAVHTPVAQAQSEGWVPPEAVFGEATWDGVQRFTRWDPSAPRGDFRAEVFRYGWLPTGLLPHAVSILRGQGLSTRVLDERQGHSEGVPDSGPLDLRPYQRDAVEALLRSHSPSDVQNGFLPGRGVLVAAPRAGKTRTVIEAVRRLALPTVWIAPSKNIVQQTVRAFENLLGKHYATELVGSSSYAELSHMRVHVMTAATAAALAERADYWPTRAVMIVDELHHSVLGTGMLGRGRQWERISRASEGIYFRFGMTGTYARSGDDFLALEAFLSQVSYRISPTELVAAGFLTPTKVAFLPIVGPLVKSRSGVQWMQKGSPMRAGITDHVHRQAVAAWATEVLARRGLRVLVLVSTKEQGDVLRAELLEKIPGVPGSTYAAVEFVSTDRPARQCREIIDAFTEGDSIRVLIGTSMVGEGTDLPSTDALVYAQGGKAEVSHTQAMYRVATKTAKKEIAVVVDFADRHNRTLLAHSLERAQTYLDQGIFSADALATLEEFPAWLEWQLAQATR